MLGLPEWDWQTFLAGVRVFTGLDTGSGLTVAAATRPTCLPTNLTASLRPLEFDDSRRFRPSWLPRVPIARHQPECDRTEKSLHYVSCCLPSWGSAAFILVSCRFCRSIFPGFTYRGPESKSGASSQPGRGKGVCRHCRAPICWRSQGERWFARHSGGDRYRGEGLVAPIVRFHLTSLIRCSSRS